MKKCLHVLFLALMGSCHGPSIELNSLEEEISGESITTVPFEAIEMKNGVAYTAGKKYSGYGIELNSETGDTLTIQGFLGGQLHGVSKKWYPNGQLLELRHYTSGEKNGKQLSFWENGNKRFEFTAVKDAYEGELKEWNEAGDLIHLGNFANGQEEGTQKLFYDNGKIRANYVILQGKRYGLLGTKNCTNVSDSVFSTN